MYDLCCFLVLCTDVKMRQELERSLIDLYYDRLCKAYAEHNLKPNFNREQIRSII
jgi:hypothetical protein